MKLQSIVFLFLLCSIVFVACKKTSIDATKMLIVGPDKELVEGLRQKAKRDSINRTPEQREAIRKQQEENARIAEMREAEIERMRAEGGETAKYYDDELQSEEKWEMSYNQGLLLVAVILGGVIFMFWWFVIRKIRNNIRDISYTKNEVENKMDFVMNDPRFNEMSDEERQSMAKMKKFLNGNK